MNETALELREKLNRTPNGEIVRIGENVPGNEIAKTHQTHNTHNTHRPVSFVTEKEVNAMADAARSERDRLLILVLFQCCLRASEAVQLTPKHRVTVDGHPVLAVLGKGSKPRLVPMPEALSRRFGDYCFEHEIGPTQRLFPVTRFRALQIVKECGERANIGRRVYTHLLRHGGAVTRLEKTGNPKSLQMYLGHNDIKMTMRYLSTLQAVQSLQIEAGVTFDE